MGLFYNFSSQGPGVDKNAPKKKGIFLFFELFGRKIGKIIESNIIFFLCSLPMLLIYSFLSAPAAIRIVDMFLGTATAENVQIQENLYTGFALFFTTTAAILLGTGPASAALAFVHRCFRREEHTWLRSDFFAKMKENFKQGLIVAVIDLAAVAAGFTAIWVYWSMYLQKGSSMWFLLACIVGVCMFIYIAMHYFIYQLMVTFENKTVDLYKNALLLTLSTLPMSLLLTSIICVLLFFVCTTMTSVMTIILSFVILLSALRFVIEFYATGVIKRKILNNIEDNGAETKGGND